VTHNGQQSTITLKGVIAGQATLHIQENLRDYAVFSSVTKLLELGSDNTPDLRAELLSTGQGKAQFRFEQLNTQQTPAAIPVTQKPAAPTATVTKPAAPVPAPVQETPSLPDIAGKAIKTTMNKVSLGDYALLIPLLAILVVLTFIVAARYHQSHMTTPVARKSVFAPLAPSPKKTPAAPPTKIVKPAKLISGDTRGPKQTDFASLKSQIDEVNKLLKKYDKKLKR